MKKETNKRRVFLSVLLVMVMLGVTLLTACSSSQVSVTPTKEEDTKAEVTPKGEQVEEVTEPKVVEEPKTTNEIEETTEEIIQNEEEPEVEDDEYAEIDMESTLPGIEWIQTFDGIIDEPKLVVFNDSTNKKVILEELQEVEFYDDDTLAVYIPKERGKMVQYLNFEEVEYHDNIVILRKMPSCIRREGYSSPICIDIEFDGKPMTLYCYLKLMGNP